MQTNDKMFGSADHTWLMSYELILILLIHNALSQDAPASHVQQYTIRSHIFSWNISKVTLPVTRCLLMSSNPEAATIMCDQKYNQTILEESLEVFSLHKAAVGSLDLVCALDDPEETNLYKTCVCADVKLDPETPYGGNTADSLNTTSHNNPTNESKDGSNLFKITNMKYSSCTYPETLTKHMMQGYTQLNVLNIEDISLEGIENGAFDDFRESLQVLHLKKLPLREENIPDGLLCNMSLYFVLLHNFTSPMKEFPRKLFTSENGSCRSDGLSRLLGVFADGNNFTELPSHLVGNGARSLVVLNVSSNGIKHIATDALHGMTSLRELNLDQNDLADLPPAMFASLASLLYLSLQYNQLESLDLSVFQPLPRLQELRIGGNRLRAVEGSFSVLPSLTTLDMEENRLSDVNAIMFSGCYYIADISIGHNLISHIDSQAFRSLLSLGKLELKYNLLHNATNLQQAFHGKLESLQYLGLSNNLLMELLPRQFQKKMQLQNLRILDLKYNKIREIHEDCFLDMSEMTMITLSFNELTRLKAKTFRPLHKLLTLWMDDNRLEEFPDDAIPPKVLWLSLSNNKLEAFPRLSQPHPTLKHIYLGYNNISYLDNSTFTNYPALTLLNLTQVGLREISEGTFDSLGELQALDLSKNKLNLDFSIDYLGNIYKVFYLNLSNNDIQSADNLFKHHIKYAQTLDISSNPLKQFPDQPKSNPFGTAFMPNLAATTYLYIKNCSLEYVHPKAFELLPNLIHLDLSENKLHYLDRLHIAQEVKSHYFVFLYNNPIHCNCHMTWLKQPPYSTYYKLSHCRLETTQELIPFQSVTKNQFLCQEVTNCLVADSSCTCFTNNDTHRTVIYVQCIGGHISQIPNNIPATSQILDFHGNNFGTLSFESVPNKMATTELHLRNSGIFRIGPNQFIQFYQLEILDLSDNNLVELTGDMFTGLYKLQELHLQDNIINTIHPEVFTDTITLQVITFHGNDMVVMDSSTMATINQLPYLLNLSLHDNPWECGCDNATFKHWLQNLSDILQNESDIQCNSTAILSLPDDRFVCYDTTVYKELYYEGAVTTVGVLAVILALLLIGFIMVYKHRELMYVIVYHKCGWRWSVNEDEDCVYDAYIVYTDKDKAIPHWVRLELLQVLEPSLRLFVADRDSMPGHARSEEIITTIQRSKRTVFILSQDALQDDFFLFAFQSAYNYMQETGNHHSIVLIVMDNVPIKEQLDSFDTQLQAFIKTKHYIKQTDKHFWKKLTFYLPDPQKENMKIRSSTGNIDVHPSNNIDMNPPINIDMNPSNNIDMNPLNNIDMQCAPKHTSNDLNYIDNLSKSKQTENYYTCI